MVFCFCSNSRKATLRLCQGVGKVALDSVWLVCQVSCDFSTISFNRVSEREHFLGNFEKGDSGGFEEDFY